MFCHKCLKALKQTEWKPPKGYDNDLVEYHCVNCGHNFYVTTHYRFKVKALIKASKPWSPRKEELNSAVEYGLE